jgi:hypothetical protein
MSPRRRPTPRRSSGRAWPFIWPILPPWMPTRVRGTTNSAP